MLTGTEVKSLRNGKASIKEAYARVRNGEVFLEGMNITPYEQGNRYNHDPVRTRKLLLHRREIEKLIGAVEQKGLTLVPLELYFKNGRAKVALALGRGKKTARQARGAEAPGVRAGGGTGCVPGTQPGRTGALVIAGLALLLALGTGSPPQITIAGAGGEVKVAVRADPPVPRWSPPRSSWRRSAARSRSPRAGPKSPRPAAVPLPGRRAAVRLQQPAPAAGRAGLARS